MQFFRNELKLQIFIGDEETMSKRKTEEIERLEGIGEAEVEENGFEVEEAPKGEFTGFKSDEEEGEDI